MTKVELVKGQTFTVDPTKQYMIIFQLGSITRYNLAKIPLPKGSFCLLIDGDPQSVKVIEREQNDQEN